MLGELLEKGYSLEDILRASETSSHFNCDCCKFPKFCNVCTMNWGYLMPVRNDVGPVFTDGTDANTFLFLQWNVGQLRKQGASKTRLHKVAKKLAKIANS